MEDDSYDMSDAAKIREMYRESGVEPCIYCNECHPALLDKDCRGNPALKKANLNLPAFPQHPNKEIDSGLTNREYIAIHVMKALIQSDQGEPVCTALAMEFAEANPGREWLTKYEVAELTAKASCIYADALLKELETPNDPNC